MEGDDKNNCPSLTWSQSLKEVASKLLPSSSPPFPWRMGPGLRAEGIVALGQGRPGRSGEVESRSKAPRARWFYWRGQVMSSPISKRQSPGLAKPLGWPRLIIHHWATSQLYHQMTIKTLGWAAPSFHDTFNTSVWYTGCRKKEQWKNFGQPSLPSVPGIRVTLRLVTLLLSWRLCRPLVYLMDALRACRYYS